ncbi:glycosyltransferase family 2 protein [Cohnella sp. GCM10020058]|uniref:glycosyltransferase family 2 protein n=1 Tax=Cohnella sp. GCM10020058 TaxID=3317330 RepID=UPI00362EE094
MMSRLRLRLNGAAPWTAGAALRDARIRLKNDQERLKRQRSLQHKQLGHIDHEIEELRRRLSAARARVRLLGQTDAVAWLVEAAPRLYHLPEQPVEGFLREGAPAPILKEAILQEPPTMNDTPLPRLGDRLVHDGHLRSEQLTVAMERQQAYGGRLGDILIEMGLVTPETLIPYISNPAEKTRLGDLLLQSGLLTQQQLDKALSFQRKSGGILGDILLSLRFIEPEALYRIIANQNRIGRVGTTVSVDADTKLPESVAREFGAIIIHEYPNRYLIAVSDPLNDERRQALEEMLSLPVEQVLASKGEMELFWAEAYNSEMLHESTNKLAEDQPHNSASKTFTRPQLVFAAISIALLATGFVWRPLATLIGLNLIVQLFYVLMTLFKFNIILIGSRTNAQFRFSTEEVAALNERDLPVYTILVPMYKESSVIPSLIGNLERLDYPKAKLDVRLLIERDDTEAIELLQRMRLPSYYTVLILPDSLPKTKPKACNYGLIRARGEYVVIYDAEDQPDRDQLKKVILTFNQSSEEYACIQAKLNYFNSRQNWLTRWFTQEYSMWFELLLPGIMKLDVPIPLGGTSNHFKTSVLKEMGAWDPYNVTEDADLGIRLYKAGYKTAIVDSRTWEEANSRVGNWIRQRSRWVKGYMQTWLVHMRNPFRLFKELGFRGFLGFQVMILATPLLPLLNPIFWALLVLWFGWHLGFIRTFYPGILYYMSSLELYLGNFFFVYSNIAGVYWVIQALEKSRDNRLSYGLVRSALLSPIYWVLMSVAAIKAAWQLITKPFYWEKTVHGLSEGTAQEEHH